MRFGRVDPLSASVNLSRPVQEPGPGTQLRSLATFMSCCPAAWAISQMCVTNEAPQQGKQECQTSDSRDNQDIEKEKGRE
ncbi:hypothetical protein ACLKA6_005571 [Drosophila palustris]